MKIIVTPDNSKASDCLGTGPIFYDTVADVLERAEQLNIIFGKDNWSAYQTVKINIGESLYGRLN